MKKNLGVQQRGWPSHTTGYPRNQGILRHYVIWKFHGVENYLVMAGQKADNLDERIGYYGEQLVLLAQALGLNTCWAGLSYRKVNGAYKIEKGRS